MSTPSIDAERADDAGFVDGDWVFPVRDAAVTTRAALVAGATALSLVLLAVLAFVCIVLIVVEPGGIVPWMPLALLPFAGCSIAAWRWEPIPALGYLAIGVVVSASFVALTVAVAGSPLQSPAGTAGFVLSMTTNIAVLIGASSDRWTGGIVGAIGGWVLAEGTIAITAAYVDLPYRVDVPPIAIAVGVALGYALVPVARTRARQGTASLEDADRRTRARQLREVEGRESIAELHDSLLGGLAALALREPGPLTPAETEGLARALDSSAMLPVLRTTPEADPGGMAAHLRSIGEAGGVRFVIEGDIAELDALPEPAGSALRAALEQCVVNVARHAGVQEAWIAVASTAEGLSATVVDEGVGFDLASVPHDRLGLSESVRGRVERCGGSVRVWSRPGAGTSVHIVIPRGE